VSCEGASAACDLRISKHSAPHYPANCCPCGAMIGEIRSSDPALMHGWRKPKLSLALIDSSIDLSRPWSMSRPCHLAGQRRSIHTKSSTGSLPFMAPLVVFLLLQCTISHQQPQQGGACCLLGNSRSLLGPCAELNREGRKLMARMEHVSRAPWVRYICQRSTSPVKFFFLTK